MILLINDKIWQVFEAYDFRKLVGHVKYSYFLYPNAISPNALWNILFSNVVQGHCAVAWGRARAIIPGGCGAQP